MNSREMVGEAIGQGIGVLRRVAASPLLERAGLRPTFEKLVFEGARLGYGAISTLGSRKSPSSGQRPDASLQSSSGPPGTFDLHPSDEQEMIIETLRRYVQDALVPQARRADDEAACPAEVLASFNELGLASLVIPERFGGDAEARSPLTMALIGMELAKGDMGIAWRLLSPLAVANLLIDFGTVEQQERYLPRFVGERPAHAAIALQEPAGLFDPFALQTRARRSGAGWVLQGHKTLVCAAAEAELFVVAADTEEGPALFVVSPNDEGVEVEDNPPMGLRSASVADLRLNAVHLEDDARIASGEDVYAQLVERARLAWSALACGTAASVVEFVGPYANERVAFGEPISHRQAVAFLIADIALEAEGMRLCTLKAASRMEYGMASARSTWLARTLCAEKAMYVGTNGVQLLGGHGFVKEYLMELWYRNLRGAGLMEGGLYL